MYLICLVRDPQSVVASFTNPGAWRFSSSAVVASAYVWFTDLLASLVFLTHPGDRRLFVRYEDFAADPESVIGEILRQIAGPDERPDFAAPPSGYTASYDNAR